MRLHSGHGAWLQNQPRRLLRGEPPARNTIMERSSLSRRLSAGAAGRWVLAPPPHRAILAGAWHYALLPLPFSASNCSSVSFLSLVAGNWPVQQPAWPWMPVIFLTWVIGGCVWLRPPHANNPCDAALCADSGRALAGRHVPAPDAGPACQMRTARLARQPALRLALPIWSGYARFHQQVRPPPR